MTLEEHENGWLDLAKTADILGVSVRSVHRYIKDGKLKSRKIKGKVYVSSDSLSQYRDDIVVLKKESWQTLKKTCEEQQGRINVLMEREQNLLEYKGHCDELEAKNESLLAENEMLKNRSMWSIFKERWL